MVAQVDLDRLIVILQIPGLRAQIASGTEQAMNQDQRPPLATRPTVESHRVFAKLCHCGRFPCICTIVRMRRPCRAQDYAVNLFRVLICCLLTPLAVAGNNATVYPYKIDESILAKGGIDTVMLATGALGKPPRQYLQAHQAKVTEAVVKYLEKNKFTVLDNRGYAQALSKAESSHGAAYDPGTDQMDMNTQQRILGAVFAELRKSEPGLDAVIFADLLSREVYFSVGLKRVARWDGVSRQPLTQGAGQGVPLDFDWSQAVDAASVGVFVFTPQGQRVFMSVGGLSLTEAIDTSRSKPTFVRYRKVLSSKSQIKEGVALAFHPLIPMKRYPGKP